MSSGIRIINEDQARDCLINHLSETGKEAEIDTLEYEDELHDSALGDEGFSWYYLSQGWEFYVHKTGEVSEYPRLGRW